MDILGTDNLAVIILASVSIVYQLRRASVWLGWQSENFSQRHSRRSQSSSRGRPPRVTEQADAAS